MSQHQTYSIAISRSQVPILNSARGASGDVVLGFALTRIPDGPAQERITCELLNAGASFSDASMKACLETLCKHFGQGNVQRAVCSWLNERASAQAPMWARTC